MSRVTKFWSDFTRDPEKLSKAQSFSLVLWQGITSDTRPKIWSMVGEEYLPRLSASDLATPFPNETKEEFKEGVYDELEASSLQGLAPMPERKVVERVQKLLIDHAQRNGIDCYQTGSAQLLATILGVVQNEPVALALMQKLHDALSPYRSHNDRLMMKDILVLADVIVSEMPAVAETFNKLQFDVVDLSDIASAWASALFASYFPSNAVVRLLDILLFEGPEAIVGNIFGVLKVYKNEICAQQERESFFAFLTNLPPSMTDRQVDEALKLGYKVFRVGAKHMQELRKKKDWEATLSAPGPLPFTAGVGNPTLARPSSRLEEKLGPIFQDRKDRERASAARQRRHDRDPSSGRGAPGSGNESNTSGAGAGGVPSIESRLPDVIFHLEKTRRQGLDPNMQKVMEEAAKVLRRQHESIQRLQVEMKQQEERYEQSGDLSSEESSGSSFDNSETDLVSSGTEQQPRFDREKSAVPKGCVPHSKLFQHQQFPCLYMEGYLLKARRKAAGKGIAAFGNLHRRFFVLQGSFVTYFKSHRQTKPSHDVSVDMRGRRITRLEKHKFGKYGFEISDLDSDQCLYLLFASNADERNVWAQVLQAAAES